MDLDPLIQLLNSSIKTRKQYTCRLYENPYVSHYIMPLYTYLITSPFCFSARMVWKGLEVKYNRPEMRCYSLWLNSTKENPYLRKYGMCCLLDHEIGTHFVSFIIFCIRNSIKQYKECYFHNNLYYTKVLLKISVVLLPRENCSH